MVKVGDAMDHPTQPVPAQTVDLTSMQSPLACLHEITDAGDGRQANAFMWAIINNLWISIGSAPNPILSATYPTKLVGQHLLCWIKEFLAHNVSFYPSPHRAGPAHEVLAGLWDPSSFRSRDQSAYSQHDYLNEGTPLGVRRKKIVVGSVFKAGPRHMGISCKIKKQVYFNLQNGKLAYGNVARSEESIVLSKEVADDNGGMFQEHFKENLSFLTCPLLKMATLPNFTNFAFRCGQEVPSNWTEAHAQSLYDSILVDPIQSFTPHLTFLQDKTAQITKVTGTDASTLRRQQATVFRQICPFIQQCYDINWLATSDPMSSDADTGSSDSEAHEDEDEDEDPPAIPMDEDLTPSEGEDSGNEVGKEWQVASEISDDGSGEEEEEEKVEGEDNKTSNTDDKREQEQEEQQDQLNSGEVLDSAPKTKDSIVHLNQQLRQGKTQPAMHAHMVEMEEKGLLKPADEKCDCCHGGHHCLLPIKSDNGHPTCAECLISSHGCPNHIAHATPAKKKPVHSTKGKTRADPTLAKHLQAFMLVSRLCRGNPTLAGTTSQPEVGPSSAPSVMELLNEYNTFSLCPMQSRPALGHGALFQWFEPPQGGSLGSDPCPHPSAGGSSSGARVQAEEIQSIL
ncbi:hypothetical protein ARMGADRAFT_1034122 [Armillaria gallica]|uniref:Uncharacterized protein n=1 Tax=Armillaria gallica TaxID=47427 RepID=A0A2H3DIT6_ARMGA|nr:hypothetical protein ARMGADRAFT_1034122 [Armillaria gallica]